MNDHDSHGGGLLTLGVCVLLFLGVHRFFPALASVLLTVGGILLVLIAVIVIMVIAASRRGRRDKNASSDTDSILAACRAHMLEIRRMTARIRDKRIHKAASEIIPIPERILRTLKEKPERMHSVRSFWNYYLPTLRKILCKYVQLEESGVDASETGNAVLNCLGDIRSALQKQYENLFAADQLDLSVEMEVLSRMCKRDGLLGEEDFPVSGENDTETLP